MFAEAVHQALQLPQSYPVSNIHVWIEQSPASSVRRQLLGGMPNKKFVLGFQLVNLQPSVVSPQTVVAKLTASNTTVAIADQLAVTGFVTPEQLGVMSAGYSTDSSSEPTTIAPIGEYNLIDQ